MFLLGSIPKTSALIVGGRLSPSIGLPVRVNTDDFFQLSSNQALGHGFKL